MSDFLALRALGYSLDNNGRNLCFPDGERVLQIAQTRIRSYAVTYADIALMVHAIDLLDGEGSPCSGHPDGDAQYDQLIRVDPARALIFLALRRRQRSGDIASFRRGLVIATAYNKGEICEGDALWHFEADLELASCSRELEAYKSSLILHRSKCIENSI